MFNMVSKLILLAVLVIGLNNNFAFAVTPEEACKAHTENNAPGTCSVCGSQCIKITSNLGENIYKTCDEVQCTLTNTCKNDCPDCGCEPRT